MTALNIEVLKKIVENIPEDYTLEFDNGRLPMVLTIKWRLMSA